MDLYDIRTALNAGKSIYDLPLRVTYYARVSTDKDEQLHSLAAQVRYYTEYIQRNPRWVFVEGYVDEGISGTTVGKRENFLRMVQDAEAGHFDFILTKEISRFSRNTLDSIKYTQDLLRYGVGVLFESDNINTLMPDAELRLTLMSSIAQDEVRKISERVKFGFKRAIENGVVLGNNKMRKRLRLSARFLISTPMSGLGSAGLRSTSPAWGIKTPGATTSLSARFGESCQTPNIRGITAAERPASWTTAQKM